MDTLPPFSTTTVLIIGGGPTGLTAALLLSRFGLKSVIVERHFSRMGQPKAHAINPRSLEIFRQIGLDTAHLRSQGVKPEDGDAVRFSVSMSGQEHGVLPYERQGEETRKITPEPLFNIPQPILEDFLLEAVAKNEMITFHRGMQWESCSQASKNVLSSKITDRVNCTSKVIESAYILDCGGANSRARQYLEVPFSPLPEYQQNEVHHISVHMKADLTKFRPATLWWISSSLAEGTFICYNRTSEWVFVTYYDPKTTSRETFSEEYCRELIDNAIGEKVPYEILSITVWSTWPRTAEYYQSKRFHHAFVVGDAAHAFPPTGGLGVNTGIADAQNLAWKINAIEKAWADDGLLDSYGTERRPIAIANARQSVKNQVKLRNLKAALRYPPSTHTPGNTSDWIRWKERLDHELRENSEHFDSINLQIGYVYGRDDCSDVPCDYYIPSGIPGARLPHTWISYDNRTISILDLVTGESFVLFTSEPSDTLSQAVISNAIQVPVRVIPVGVGFHLLDDSWLDVVGLSMNKSGLLIRPDQHILGSGNSVEDIERLLKVTLGS